MQSSRSLRIHLQNIFTRFFLKIGLSLTFRSAPFTINLPNPFRAIFEKFVIKPFSLILPCPVPHVVEQHNLILISNQNFTKMKVQFAGRIATEPVTREVPSENGNFNSTEFSVAEIAKDRKDKDGVFHTIQFTGSDKVLPYLKKGNVIEIDGDFTYANSKEDEAGKKHKYYRVNTKQITLLASSQSNKEETPA